MDRGEHRFAQTCSGRDPGEGEGDGQPDNGDDQLQWISPRAKDVDCVFDQRGGQAAGFLAEGEQDDVIKDNATCDGCHQPCIRPACREGAHQKAFDCEAEYGTARERGWDAEPEGPAQRHHKCVAHDRAEHH